MKIITNLDDWLLDNVFQRFADWFQRLTGKDSFFLARVFVVIMVTMNSCERVFFKNFSVPVASNIVVALMALIASYVVASRYYRCELPTQCMNFMRNIMPVRILRVFITGLLVWQIICTMVVTNVQMIVIGIYVASTMTYVYLIACSPKPPTKSRFRELIESFSGIFYRSRAKATSQA